MNKWLYIICCLPLLFGCKDSGDDFDPVYENNLLVWGSDANGEKYECCWVQINENRKYIYKFNADYSLVVQFWLNDEFLNAKPYTYKLLPGIIDLDQRLYKPDGEQFEAQYEYRIDGDYLTLKTFPDDRQTTTEPFSIDVLKRSRVE